MPPVTTKTYLYDLLNKAELQGTGIIARAANAEAYADSFQTFRSYIDEIDKFYVLVDLVEDQLPLFDPTRQALLAKNLVNLRWQVCIVEVNATHVFLVRISSAKRALPLGSRDFLIQRSDGIGKIENFYSEFGQSHGLQPIAETLLNAVRQMLADQIDRTQSFSDFGADTPERQGWQTRSETPSLASKPAVTMQPIAKTVEFRVKTVYGRFYADKDAVKAVSDACASANMSMDDLAEQFGVSRTQLSLMLNGADAIPTRMVDEIRSLIARVRRPPVN